ncbi:MAG TPA: MATE family efflux transporter [Atribacterota bacterium]|nr:MATE family efflux transporter [Atribacterota bacterium]
MDEKRIKILRDEAPLKAIWSLSVPTILAMWVQVFYNLTDTFFVGRLNDPFKVAAVSVAFPIYMFLMAFSGIFGFGAASYISRLLGEKNYSMAKKTSSTAFYTCIVAAIFITIVSLIFISPILTLIGVTPETHKYAYEYLSVIFSGSLIIMTNFMFTQLLRSEGAAKVSMFGMFIGTGLNIILDPIFIITLGYGVKGAAIATLIGQVVASLYYIFGFYSRKKSLVSLNWKYFSPGKGIYQEILRVGVPASIHNLMISLAQTMGNFVAAGYSDLIVAGYGVVQRIFSMCIMTLIGLSDGTQPLIGYSYGARNIKRLYNVIKTAVIIATGISVFFVVFFYFVSGKMIQIFINNEQVIYYGTQIMRAMMISLPFAGIQFLIRVSFQALGKGKPALILALVRQGIFYAPALFILNKYFGFAGFIYAQPIANAFSLMLAIILFIGIREQISNEHLKVENEETATQLSKLDESFQKCP